MYGVECLLVFFFKQKTAYEMRISDWSSDVCSSDLDRPARFRASRHRLCPRRDDRRIEEPQALPVQLPQPCGVPRGLHRRHRPPPRRRNAAEMAAHRRLLVSARRHPDRRLLAIQPAARGPVAPRPGRRVLSRKRLSVAPAKAGSAGSMKPRWGNKPIANPAFAGATRKMADFFNFHLSATLC